MSSFEWLNKLEKIIDESNQYQGNPTAKSMLYMINHMVDEYREYKKLGSLEDLKKYKAIALGSDDNE